MHRQLALGVLFLLVLVPNCYGDEPVQAQLQGTDTSRFRVLIRKIDGGEVLWVGKFKLGTTAVVAPGQHTVEVMCEVHELSREQLRPGRVTLAVEAGRTYDLVGTPSVEGMSCNLEAKPRP